MWERFDNLRWYLRWPVKWAALGAAIFVVSFPNPLLFVRHVQHWRDPNAMIDADLPALQPWVQEVRASLKPEMQPGKALKTVQQFVYQKVPYKYDWQTWGSADYLPTLPEVLDMGAEDCDGRAVVAASILRGLGYRAELVTDFAHVWVKTDKGETMGPGKHKSIVATRWGLEVHWKTLSQTLPRALGYGISAFPLGRELIVLAVLWLVLLRAGIGWPLRLLGLAVMLEGLLFMRAGGGWRLWALWWGVLHLGGAALAMVLCGWRTARVRAGNPAAAPLENRS